jgi:hypothetical protein
MERILYRKLADCVEAEMGDAIGVVHVDTGHYYALNETAAAIWRMLDDALGLDEICAGLAQIYDVAPDRCRDEVRALLTALTDRGIVVAVHGAAATERPA